MDITLVFPHQLFEHHPGIQANRSIALMADGLILGGDPQWPLTIHPRKFELHQQSMLAYKKRLESKGHSVLTLTPNAQQQTSDLLNQLIDSGYQTFYLADPVDDLLTKRVRKTLQQRSCVLEILPTPMLLTPTEVMDDYFNGRRKPMMVHFYQMQRKRLGVLIDDQGAPVGGRWSFDADNRKKLPKGITVPEEPSIDFPVDHLSAQQWLDTFLEHRLAGFGTYEDAISSQHRVMWHSVLTPMLNLGLLTPQQVLNRTLAAADASEIPLNSLEGFLRQIIGWREFMAAMYLRHGVTMRNSNFWNFEDRPIPDAFYQGTTGIPPIDDAIKRALNTGYCHHIERLMLLGNMMLLCGFHPTRIYTWFMELFVDAYDWVMVPNVYGMSQFADGGIFTSKPYLSGSNYVRKMSDYKQGDWCGIWDGLFWSFIHRHGDFFRSQPRLAMMTRNLDRMAPEVMETHYSKAQQFLDSLS
ncbi:MAG: cryptochrome/photolyase family protein [Synechococcus sp. SP2 MAG]|jgi:deoxyribodipyrimidine photolyase-related protein|nr:cryptochrome/photolyase family protein [Synechococcus sp. SP2 MAG]